MEFLAAFVAFVVVMLALYLGPLFGRAGVKGSCGGLGSLPGFSSDCGGACNRPCKKRQRESSSRLAAKDGADK